MRKAGGDAKISGAMLALCQAGLLCVIFGAWYVLTETGVLAPFFFGRPFKVALVIWEWFASGKIYPHLAITLVETILAFAVGSLLGLGIGLWLALSPLPSALADPYI
jgi:NitT/TauT family transport system permease protein